MRWIQTYTGKVFNLDYPDRKDVDITDIAHALSLQCRFNGHTRKFYSVAQHSVLVSQQVTQIAALHGLLHDAAEAYIGDIISPVKNDENKALESRVLNAIYDRFLIYVPDYIFSEVKRADLRMLRTEQEELLPGGPEYECCSGVERYTLDLKVNCWGPQRAESEFMSRFLEVFNDKSAG